MELEINKNHKKIDLKSLKKPLKNIVIGSLVAVDLFTGAIGIDISINEDKSVQVQPTPIVAYAENYEDIVNISEDYKTDIIISLTSAGYKISSTTEITKEDLNNLKRLDIAVYDASQPLDFISYCNNLEELDIIDKTGDMSYLKEIKNKNLKSIKIQPDFGNTQELIKHEDLEFIKNCPNLKKVDLYMLTIDVGSEEILNNLDTVSFYSEKCDIDFNKLTNIKNLDVSSIEPLTLAVYLNSEEYNNLIDNNVNIIFKDEESKILYFDACKKLDNIVSNLGVDKNSSDKEKLDAILIYTLETLEYDKDVREVDENNQDHDDLSSSFYEDGNLKGALYKNSAICGNYAALVEALSDRLGSPTDSYYATSSNHAFNIVNIEGETYIVDATWLDHFIVKNVEEKEENENGFTITFKEEKIDPVSLIKEGRGEELTWYLADMDVSDIDKDNAHEFRNPVPNYVYDTSKKGNKVSDITNKEFKIKVGTKEYIILGGALIGILTALGIAVKVNKKKKEKIRKMNEEQFNNIFSSYDSYGSSNNTYSGYGRKF